MINYRSLKKMLGETSLERKCRLLFGLALLILITTSFGFYADRTRRLVEATQITKAHELIPDILWRRHMTTFYESSPEDVQTPNTATPANTAPKTDNATPVFEPLDWPTYKERLSEPEALKLGGSWNLILNDEVPSSTEVYDIFQELKLNDTETSKPLFKDDAEGNRELHYFEAIRASESCMACHNGTNATSYGENEFVAMAAVQLSMSTVESELSRNRAFLLASGIVTTFLAMLAAYVIVRYIIVKPVLHLKDVSDAIARGNLNLRAEINTGDEFEELGHAFNRMLRHMTTVNEELRGVNDNLDAKVDLLAQANMELFNSNAMKDEFLATMSHELRTPLNSILGFSDVLAGAANLDDRQQRYVDNIRTSGRNLMVQINDLLDLAKIESGQMKLKPAALNVKELIETQSAQLMPLADQKNIELRSQFPTKPLPELTQDAGKVRQILTNLLSNAIKFTPEGGRIRVGTQMIDADTIEISVEDTGIGIPMHEQDEIFEKFRQGNTTSGERDQMKREYGGTGLGLSIVRELSRLLGGDVFLESEFGKGSIFMVHLPLIAPPEKSPELLEATPPPILNRITSADLLNAAPDKSDATDHGNGNSEQSTTTTVETERPDSQTENDS